MDLKLLLSPAQKDPEDDPSSRQDSPGRTNRPLPHSSTSTTSTPPPSHHQHHPYPPQQHFHQQHQPYPQHQHYPPQLQQQQQYNAYHPQQQHHHHPSNAYYPQHEQQVPQSSASARNLYEHPSVTGSVPTHVPHSDRSSHGPDQRPHPPGRSVLSEQQQPRTPMIPPTVSISASSPLNGSTQPLQYFVPSHKPAPVLPPPTGLNLSSYSFLLMEKRDREREAQDRTGKGSLAESAFGRNEPLPRGTSPSLDNDRSAQFTQRPQEDHSFSQQQQHYGHPPSMNLQDMSSDSRQYQPTHGHGYGGQDQLDGRHFQHPQHYHPYQHDGHAPRHHPHPAHLQQGPHPILYQHHQHHHHHHHSNSSTNIGVDPPRSQHPQHGSYQQQQHHLHQDYNTALTDSTAPPNLHRAMSPGLLDRPRFANANLSVFRQSAAEDSDGNASVSSSGSHKRRRRPKQSTDGKKVLPGSALSTTQGNYRFGKASSTGSGDVQEDFYDEDDSSDEHLDVRNGLQSLNLQRSTKTNASGAKKMRTKADRPFKIGELTESMKSDTDGTWFAGRVLDLEDDPHDHINPKSVLIHFEGFSPHHDEWVKPGQLRTCSTGSSFLRYGPLGPESPENWEAYEKFYHSDLGRTARRHTGLAYDRRMLLHKCLCNTNPEERHHPEQPERLVEILSQFQKNGMLSLVKWIQGREATIEELVAAHTEPHVRNYCCTSAENRQYARDHGLEYESEEESIEGDVEDEVEEEDSTETSKKTKDPSVRRSSIKPAVGRGRPKRGARGSIHVATTVAAAEGEAPVVGESEDTIMSPTSDSTTKDAMEVDLHSPTLGRRRSSMRGAGIRMSSLVSMSSTLYAQREEDIAPEAAALIREEEDDEDEKSTQVGPAPSEAAAAVAGGMDLSEASRLTNSPQTIPKKEDQEEDEDLAEDKNIPMLDLMQGEPAGSEDRDDGQDNKDELTKDYTANAMKEEMAKEGADTSVTAEVAQDAPPKDTEITATAASTKTKDKKADKADKVDKTNKEASKALIKKKGHQAVSPAPMPTSDSVIIRPPGLTFTMSCGQLGIAVDTTWNPVHSSTAARVAAGSLITLVDQVVTGRCKNGFAIIRPPGHHAEEDEAMGFCFFNNVGVAVNLTLTKYPLTVQKILIIDWDVHHGNGTQQIFYENPNVLYISLHRWDNGHFYPFTGAPDECGEEAGEGKNVNIAWSSYGRAQAMGDIEYIAAFWYVLLPIARQFQPDLVMVSAGFDAADGHAANIGGYTVSPQGFAILTRLVQTLAGGRVILSLEGGYEFEPLAMSATACLEELLPHSLLPATAPTRAFPFTSFQGTLNSVKPNAMAVSSLHQVLKYQQKYWKFPAEVLHPGFRFHLPAEWKASNSLATRPRRERNPRRKAPVLDS